VDTTSTHVSAVQRIVLVSTLGKGFCVDLQISPGHLSGWQIEVSGSAGTYLERSELGYRLCTRRPGRYDMALKHEFELAAAGGSDRAAYRPSVPLSWPVHLSLTTP
jgi:hypothetical protein